MKFTGLLDGKDVEIDESSPSGSEYELLDAEESESSGPLSDDDKDDESDGEIKDDDSDRPSKTTAHEEEPLARGQWFDTEEPQPGPTRRPSPPPPAKSHSPPALAEREEGEAEEGEDDTPVRLAPLASSSIPSIREFLAMDMENEKQAKRQERRDKKKGKAKRAGDDDDD